MAGKAPKHDKASKPASGGLLARLTEASRAARAWASASRSRMVSLAATVVGVALVLGVVVLGQARRAINTVERPEEKVTLQQAFEALDSGFLAEARELATKLKAQTLPPDEQGGPSFVLGAIAMREAADLLDEDQRNYYAVAARYLEASRAAGFPAGREAEAWFLLGKSLCLSGRTLDGRTMLERALADNDEHAAEIQRLLVKAYSEEPHRDLAKALEHITAYLALPDLPAADRQDGLMTQAQMYWELKDWAACRKSLDEIPGETVVSPDAALLRGRLILEEARRLKAEWQADPTRGHESQSRGPLRRGDQKLSPRPGRSTALGHGATMLVSDRRVLSGTRRQARRHWPSSPARGKCFWTRPRDWRPPCKKPICCVKRGRTTKRWTPIAGRWGPFPAAISSIRGFRPRTIGLASWRPIDIIWTPAISSGRSRSPSGCPPCSARRGRCKCWPRRIALNRSSC